MPASASGTDPIFILGITKRSGSNFLWDLVRLHPDCSPPLPIMEDFLLHYAGFLTGYINSICQRWRQWQPGEGDVGLENLLYQHLGNGLLSFLNSHTDGKRLVTKTPSVRNLEYLFALFPRACLLIVVRDGRAIVESGVKTFGWSYEVAMRNWSSAARTILDFDRNNKSSQSRYMIVRYEDLFANVEEAMLEILAFLGLNATTYDFDASANLPVRGSSKFRGGEEAVHWKPIEKTQDFNPLLRWSHWNQARHERFNWIAGEYLAKFGYEKKQFTTNRRVWAIWNKTMDINWRARTLGKAVQRRISRKNKNRRWTTGAQRC